MKQQRHETRLLPLLLESSNDCFVSISTPTMMIQPDSYTEETCKIYRINAERQKGMRVFFVPFLLIPGIIVGAVVIANIAKHAMQMDSLLFLLFIGILTSIGVWRFTHHVDETYLLVSSTRLEYHSQDVDIKTTWSNVESITNWSIAPTLLLREPAATRTSEFSRDLFLERSIPLQPFDYTDTSELGRDVHRFAPHIFAAKRSP